LPKTHQKTGAILRVSQDCVTSQGPIRRRRSQRGWGAVRQMSFERAPLSPQDSSTPEAEDR
jgi:hypothetical protein